MATWETDIKREKGEILSLRYFFIENRRGVGTQKRESLQRLSSPLIFPTFYIHKTEPKQHTGPKKFGIVNS